MRALEGENHRSRRILRGQAARINARSAALGKVLMLFTKASRDSRLVNNAAQR